MHWPKVTVVGVGLLGGSLGLALKERKAAGQIVGYVRRPESISQCQSLGVVDSASTDLTAALQNADLVVLCTPIAQMRPLAEQMLPALKPGAIVTDVGSVKGTVVQELEPLIANAGAYFIGSHPMAGGEKTGPAAARADLFEKTITLLTPTRGSNKTALLRVAELWHGVGASILQTSPEEHDDLVSRSSHLPHIVAAELANYVLSPAHPKEQAMVCANGFRDTTRVASGSPEMWRDICMANRQNLSRVLGVFIEGLQEFQHALETGDTAAIAELLEKARERRENWRAQAESPE